MRRPRTASGIPEFHDRYPDIEVRLPFDNPTKVAFGGRDMRTIFVTSTAQSLTGGSNPLDGGLFAFDAGQGLSEHTAPFDAIVIVLDGQLSLTIGGTPVMAAAGHIVRMPAHVPHAVDAVEPSRMLLTMLREPQAT